MGHTLVRGIFRRSAIVVSLFYAFSSVEGRAEESATTLTPPVRVTITTGDVMALGGWPIERRWYALSLQKLRKGGAGRVFFDVAFPAADVLHPESDDYFFSMLSADARVFLLSDASIAAKDETTILGDRILPNDRFFAPFSDGFTLTGGRLLFTAGAGTLTDFHIPSSLQTSPLLIEMPETMPRNEMTFSELLRDSVDFDSRDVVISLDYPGVTSYVVGPGNESFTTSELQTWAIAKIRTGNFRAIPPGWVPLVSALIILSPLFLSFVGSNAGSRRFPVTSLLLWGIAFGSITAAGYQLDTWFLLAAVPPAVLLVRQNIPKVRTFLTHSAASERQTEPSATPGEPSDMVKELQYRLDFYERLSNQVPIDETGDAYAGEDIRCGMNSPLLEVLRKAERVAVDDIPVLIRGESGTGKEMLAQFIHRRSGRREGPLVAVNCGALNDNLIEAELFGYEKGAFTGAFQQKPGRFELASGGSLFLDEVSETSLSFQVKLLRVLQEGVIERVGGTKSIPVSVRLIAATHQDLSRSVRRGVFREDLFYRLNGYEFVIPPLRERPEDVPILFRHFLYQFDRRLRYSEPLLTWLRSQKWPGNVRQLKAATQRAVLNAQIRKRSFLIPRDFELSEATDDNGGPTEHVATQVLRGLRDRSFHHRSISAVASELMMHRSTVTEYLRGWTIRFLNDGKGSSTTVLTSLRGDSKVADEELFKRRVDEYVFYVESRIEEGLRHAEGDDEILSTRFRNLPAVFRSDLIDLIRNRRKHASSPVDAP